MSPPRSIQILAAQAQGGAGIKAPEDWLGDISGQIDRAIADQQAWNDAIEARIQRILDAFGLRRIPDDVHEIRLVLQGLGRLMPQGSGQLPRPDPRNLLDLLNRLRNGG